MSASHDSFTAKTADRPAVIVGLGELLWDLLPAGPQLGGAPGNFAYHAHALGASACVVSAVGMDDFGRRALAQLRAVGVNTDFIQKHAARPTGTVAVELNAAGQPRYTIVENVAWDGIAESPAMLALAARADAVCFGSLAQRSPVSRAAVRSFLRATRSDCLRIFDINLRAPHYSAEVIRDSLALASVFKLNDEELPMLAAMLGCAAHEDATFQYLFENFPLRLIALTRGAHGAILATREERLHLPGQPPSVLADTIGAGDAFTAALATGLLRGRPLRETGGDAIRLASYVCSRSGAMPEMNEFFTSEDPGSHTRLSLAQDSCPSFHL
jgi:fructokinase